MTKTFTARAGFVLALLAGVAAIATAGATAQTPLLAGDGGSADFTPCIAPPGGPPPISSCTNIGPHVTATCDPTGTSTISFTQSGNIYSGPEQGSFTETVTATIGPQNGPAAPSFQPFSFGGFQSGSIGTATGAITSLQDTFTINAYDGSTITGTKSLVTDLGNSGVCLDLNDQQPPSTVIGAPMTGYLYILNLQDLTYSATSDNGATTDSGPAEAYLDDTFGTFTFDPTIVSTSSGFWGVGFGTSHPATGTTTSTPTPVGTAVPAEPAPGVSLTFDSVDAAGTTSVTEITQQDAPAIPTGFEVGDPPMLYELSTTATFSGSVNVCFPSGPPPAGTTPHLLHYTGGAWVDVTTTFDPLTQTICGSVTSFSPFAAVFAPAAPKTTADCKGNGWRSYTSPRFKNQGDCVSWVATHKHG
jgi:hypothetical protein